VDRRIDYIISDKHSLYGAITFTTTRGGSLRRRQRPDHRNIGNKDRAETLTLGDTFTLGPTQVNSLHATFDRRRDDRADASNMFSPTP